MDISKRLFTNAQIQQLAEQSGYDYRVLKSIIQVESGQYGFSSLTGKIIIQFEPTWFKREYTHWAADTRHTTWQSNKVGDQRTEWAALTMLLR